MYSQLNLQIPRSALRLIKCSPFLWQHKRLISVCSRGTINVAAYPISGVTPQIPHCRVKKGSMKNKLTQKCKLAVGRGTTAFPKHT